MWFFQRQDEQPNSYYAAGAAEVATVHQTEESPVDKHSVLPYYKAVTSHELDKTKMSVITHILPY